MRKVMGDMNVLFLTVSDQQKNPLSKFVDLHRTYDFGNWIEGAKGLVQKAYVFDYYESFVMEGPLKMEEKIIALINDKSISVVVAPNIYYEIGPSFIEKIKKLGARFVMVFFDDSSRFESTNRLYLDVCDNIVTHESKRALELYKGYAGKIVFFPCYASWMLFQKLLCKSDENKSAGSEVVFVGAKFADRGEYINALRDIGINIAVYGCGWESGYLSQTEMINKYHDVKISLNFVKNINQEKGSQLKGRAFEIILAGGFLLSQYDEELCAYFDVGEEIDVFKTIEECIQKVSYYLENPDIRQEMQRKAIQKCRGEFNFERAWSDYLNQIEKSCDSNIIKYQRRQMPKIAVQTFIHWNFDVITARAMAGQVYYSIDQSKYLFKELYYLSGVYSAKVFTIFSIQILVFLLRYTKKILSRNHYLRNVITSLRSKGNN